MAARVGIFDVRTDVDACDCTVRESALEVDSGRKIPCEKEMLTTRTEVTVILATV